MWRLLVFSILAINLARIDGKVAVLPHDVYPGYEITRFHGNSRQQPSRFSLLDNAFSKYFTVLKNGLVMTTSELGPLLDHHRPIDLVVLEELANGTEVHDLRLYVMNRRHLLTFSHESLGEGEVGENLPAGSPIKGFPLLRARGNFPVHYAILPDETGERAFALREEDSTDRGFNVTLINNGQGVRVVTAKPLDRESKERYKLVIRAFDGNYVSSSTIGGFVRVLDENDNGPIFEKDVYTFEVRPTNIEELRQGIDVRPSWKRFTTIGKLVAKDDDNDKLAYRMLTGTDLLVVVPQTGELLLANEPDFAPEKDTERLFLVEAHDLRIPPKSSEKPARVIVRFLTSVDVVEPEFHKIRKRRVTRAVRPTKKIDFSEADGDVVGKIAFHLEKENEKETYKIRDENRWVTVGSNGSVMVKQKWDYEALGLEKTIDFWVTITNMGNFILLSIFPL